MWFNVYKGNGVNHPDDKDIDIFGYHTDITQNNPKKFFRSLAQSEVFSILCSNDCKKYATGCERDKFNGQISSGFQTF